MGRESWPPSFENNNPLRSNQVRSYQDSNILEDHRVRDRKIKPNWFGVHGLDIADYEPISKKESEHHVILTVDVRWNYEDDGSEHWTNSGKAPFISSGENRQ